jgi:hypothetical protein
MAKSQYSADSASLPQSPSSSNGNRVDIFKTAYIPGPFPKDTLSVSATFVVTRTNGYVGESADLRRRLPEHGAVRRTAGQSGTCNPTSISID